MERFVWKRLPLLAVGCSRDWTTCQVSDLATFPLISEWWGALLRPACQVDVLALPGCHRPGLKVQLQENEQN